MAAANAFAILAAWFGSLPCAVIVRKPESVDSSETVALILPRREAAALGSSPSRFAASLATAVVLMMVAVSLAPEELKEIEFETVMFCGATLSSVDAW